MVIVDIITVYIFSVFGQFRIMRSSYGETGLMITFNSMKIIQDSFGNISIKLSEDFSLRDYLDNFAKDTDIKIKVQSLGFCFTDIQSFEESSIFSQIQNYLESPNIKGDFQRKIESIKKREKIYLGN